MAKHVHPSSKELQARRQKEAVHNLSFIANHPLPNDGENWKLIKSYLKPPTIRFIFPFIKTRFRKDW